MTINQELQQRRLPPLWDKAPTDAASWKECRAALLEQLRRYMYGFNPDFPREVRTEPLPMPDAYIHFCAGKVNYDAFNMILKTPMGEYSIPVELVLPKSVAKAPVILHLAFRRMPDRYIPVEEILDQGVGLAILCYNDISRDGCDSNYTYGLANHFIGERARSREEWGRIGIWAWAAMGLMDVLQTRDDVDGAHIAVNGHSRLGKTALWVGAQDERFFAVHANDAGYGGSGLHRGHTGETTRDFRRAGSRDWFCEAFMDYENDSEDARPTDQHMLCACVAPRYLYVASALVDNCVDWASDLLSCKAASAAWEALGKPGIAVPDELPQIPYRTADGSVGYHVRTGAHYLSREDWNKFIAFFKDKIEQDR